MHDLTYVFDAYCGWCYGFGPAISELAGEPDVRVRVKHGALFSAQSARSINSFDHIPAANARISALTGVTFGEPYQRVLADGELVLDSEAAARGLAALRQVAGTERDVELARSMQEAFYLDGLSLSDPDTYAAIADRRGLDARAVTAAFASKESAALASQDHDWINRLGVRSFPTLLVATADGYRSVGSPTSSVAELREAILTA